MKIFQAILFLFTVAAADQEQTNPLAKVFELIDNLKNKIVADGEREQQAYQKYQRYCAKTSKDVQYEIDTATSEENKLTAKVTELESDITVGDSKIGELSGAISKTEAELKEATAIRKKEAEEFSAGEKALMDTVDSLERALSQLDKQLNGGNSFAQIDTSTLSSLMQTLSVVSDAAALSGSSMDALNALVQAHEEDGDEETGAPAATAYSKQSGGVMEVLEDIREKSEGQLSDLRASEMKAKNSYQLLSQGLQDEVSAAKKELEEEKSGKAQAEEEKASASGNLEVTKKELKASSQKLESLVSNCQTVASDHDASAVAQEAELKVIDEAEGILKESTGDAAASFLQVGAASSQRAKARQLTSSTVIKMIEQLAKQQHSASLAQLASRVSAELKYTAVRHGADPFKKVKDLLTSMIGKLEKQASEEASEKAYCDDEMSKTKAKKGEVEDDVEKLSAKIEKAASKSSALKEESTELMNELSVATKEQATAEAIRREENAAYVAVKSDLEQGLAGVRKALGVLRDFYGSGESASLLQDGDDMSSVMQQAVKQPAPPKKAVKSSGAGTGIISLLEVCESDLAKNLATADAEETDSADAFDKQTQINKVNKAEKEQDVKYKTQEFKSLDKAIAEMEADKSTEVEELNAINDYWAKVKERCVAKPTSYEELKARRDAEIQGLKDAAAALESSALVQVGNRRLRGEVARH